MAFDDGGACSGGIYYRPNWMHTQKTKISDFSSAKQSRRKADTCFAHLFIQFFTICVLATAKKRIYGFETECTHREESWLVVDAFCQRKMRNKSSHAFWFVLFRLMWQRPPFICCIGKNGIGNDNFCNSALLRNDRERGRGGGESKLNHGVLANQLQKPNELCIRVQSLFLPSPSSIDRASVTHRTYGEFVGNETSATLRATTEYIRELWTTERNRRRK